MTASYYYDGPKFGRLPIVIDDDTALWCARMCIGEGGMKCSTEKASAMLWALMNRYFLWDRKRKFRTYLDLMRAFSQPINPRWARGGDLAIKYSKTKFANEAKLKRREAISTKPWTKIPTHIRVAVNEFALGLLFPPEILTTIPDARITNWASLDSTPQRFPWGVNIDGDWFFEDRGILDGCVRLKPHIETEESNERD